MIRKMIFAMAVVLALFETTFSYADDGKISGYMFGDYYYISANHDKTIEKLNGYQIRRIYLGYDKELEGNFSTRLRLEMNSGTYLTGGTLAPTVKDAFLKWQWSANHDAVFGLSPTPTWELIEPFWGYRSVEKTMVDLYKIGSARDMGLALNGVFDSNKNFGYRVMAGGGNGNKDEKDGDKKGYLSLYAKPVEGLVIEVYGDVEPNKKGVTESTQTVFQGFVGYEGDWGNVGFQYMNQKQKQGSGIDDQNLRGYSVFGSYKITKKLSSFARADFLMDKNFNVTATSNQAYIPFDPNEKFNLYILGIDCEAAKNIHFIPNAEYVTYKNDNGGDPDDDLYLRLTLYYKF